MPKVFNIFKWIREKRKDNNDTINEFSHLYVSSYTMKSLTESESTPNEKSVQSQVDIGSIGSCTREIENKVDCSTQTHESTENDIFYRYKQYNDDYRNELCLEFDERYAILEKEYKMYRMNATKRELEFKDTIGKLEAGKLEYEKELGRVNFCFSQTQETISQLKKKLSTLEARESEMLREFKTERRHFHKIEKKYQTQISKCIQKFENYQQILFKQHENLITTFQAQKLQTKEESIKDLLKLDLPTIDFDVKNENENIVIEAKNEKVDNETERDYRSHLNPKHLASDVRIKTKRLRRLQNSHSDFQDKSLSEYSRSDFQDKSLNEYSRPELQDKSLNEYSRPKLQDKSLNEYSRSDFQDKSLNEYSRRELQDKSLREHSRRELQHKSLREHARRELQHKSLNEYSPSDRDNKGKNKKLKSNPPMKGYNSNSPYKLTQKMLNHSHNPISKLSVINESLRSNYTKNRITCDGDDEEFVVNLGPCSSIQSKKSYLRKHPNVNTPTKYILPTLVVVDRKNGESSKDTKENLESANFVQTGSRRQSYCTPEAPFNSSKVINTVSFLEGLKLNK